jgi:hypothetical protein
VPNDGAIYCTHGGTEQLRAGGIDPLHIIGDKFDIAAGCEFFDEKLTQRVDRPHAQIIG